LAVSLGLVWYAKDTKMNFVYFFVRCNAFGKSEIYLFYERTKRQNRTTVSLEAKGLVYRYAATAIVWRCRIWSLGGSQQAREEAAHTYTALARCRRLQDIQQAAHPRYFGERQGYRYGLVQKTFTRFDSYRKEQRWKPSSSIRFSKGRHRVYVQPSHRGSHDAGLSKVRQVQEVKETQLAPRVLLRSRKGKGYRQV